jgi:hypothetical protein
MNRPTGIALFCLLVVAGACNDGASTDSPLALEAVPGEGIVAGDRKVSFGDDQAALVAALGEPGASRDLGGGEGIVLGYPQHGLEVHLTGADGAATVTAFHLYAAFPKGDAPGPGSTRAQLETAWGEGEPDPFGQGLWFPAQGAFVRCEGDSVVQVDLGKPAVAAPPI